MFPAIAVRGHLTAGMREVVPDVRVSVACAAAARCHAGAEAVPDPAGGGLLLWTPPAPGDRLTPAG